MGVKTVLYNAAQDFIYDIYLRIVIGSYIVAFVVFIDAFYV